MRRTFITSIAALLAWMAAYAILTSSEPQKAQVFRRIDRASGVEMPVKPAKKTAGSFNVKTLPGAVGDMVLLSGIDGLPEMYGTVIYANGWGQSTAGVGVYSLPRRVGEYSTLEFLTQGMQGGIVVDNVYYSSLLFEVVGCPYATGFGYDVSTGDKIFERDINPMEVSVSATTDPTTGDVYAINYNSEATAHRLVKLTLSNTSWTSEEICPLSGSWNSISCDAGGQLWGVKRTGVANNDGSYTCTGAILYKINKSDGSLVEVGPLGVVPAYQSDADFDPISGILYMTVSNDNGGFLATIDTETGSATQVFSYPSGEEVVGLFFAAPGRPNSVTDLTADISASTLSGKISFVAPATDNLGSAEGQLTYTVTDNGVKIAEGSCVYGEAVSVDVTVAEGKHTFGVRVSNDRGSSKEMCVSQTITFRPDVVITLPYKNDFEGEEPVNGFSFVDTDDDNIVWNLYEDWNTANKSLRIGSSSGANLNDWAIMPAMKLETGKIYTFKCKAWGHKNNFIEKIEGFWGASPSVEGLSQSLFAMTEIKSTYDNAQVITGEIIVDKEGYYYIGLHACSTNDKNFYLYIDNLEITSGINTKVPAPVTGLTVVPDGDSKLEVTLKGTLPATDIAGNPLTSIEALEIYRDDDQLVETLTEGLVPGASFTYVDDTVLGGEHVYNLYVRNAYGRSTGVSGKAFVGYPLPAAVTGAAIIEPSDRQISVTWDAVTKDVFNLPLPSRAVRYNVYAVHGGTYEVVGRNLRECEYTFAAPIPEGKQEYVKVEVKAETTAGEGVGSISNMIPIGTPLSGYRESFAGRTISTPLMEDLISGTSGSWNVYGDETGIYSQDGDNGFIAMTSEGADESCALITGKVSLAGIDNPALVFYTYSIVGDNGEPDHNTIAVWAREYGSEDWTVVVRPDRSVYDYCGQQNDAWGRVIADLSLFSGKIVQLAIVPTNVIYASTVIDNIYTTSMLDHDLQLVSINAPRKAIAGEKFNVDVKILNNGAKTASDYSIDLYADGVKAASRKVASLSQGAYDTQTIQVEMHILSEEPVDYYAVINYDPDQNQDNNTSAHVSVMPKQHPHPAVTDLSATLAEDEKSVDLTWSEPVIETGFAQTVVEGFEDADALAKEVEDWTFLDVDNSPVGGVRGYDWPGLKAGLDNAAFFVLDTENAKGPASSELTPHSGSKMLCAIYRQDDKQVNDWAISPILSGRAQTISMYVRSFSSRYLETLELCYSTGSLAPTAFAVVKTVKPVPFDKWTKIEFDVPEGARYFALHNCGVNNFMLLVDDVTFERGNYNDLLEIRGYNIWRNGKRANTGIVERTAFTDPDPESVNSYQVTVVYEDYGQSRGSNIVNVSGPAYVKDVLESKGVSIVAADGSIILRGVGGRQVYVADINGRICFSGKGDAVISLDPGVYIVNVDSDTAKVVVR